MVEGFLIWLREFVKMFELSSDNERLFYLVLVVLSLLLLSCAVGIVCHRILVPIINKITKKTDFIWDDYLFHNSVLVALCHLITPVLFYILLPVTLRSFRENSYTDLYDLFVRLTEAYISVVTVRFVLRFLDNAHMLSSDSEKWQKHTITGLFQAAKLTAIIIGAIITISVLFGKSPLSIIAGLGAAATVIMFIFKDTILGLVSGIQLSANNMLHIGDWVTISKSGIDGVVEQITLTTVKIRGWDNTTFTVPPYALVSDSFQNWRGMKESQGRRVRRTLYIDVNSITYCDSRIIENVKSKGFYPDSFNMTDSTPNITLFRESVEEYLRNSELVNTDAFYMLRQQQGSSSGIPLELYFFLFEKDFVAYERKQSSIIEYIITMIPEFGLSLFQQPSGTDIHKIRNN